MASRQATEPPPRPAQPRPELGSILIVIREYRFLFLVCACIDLGSTILTSCIDSLNSSNGAIADLLPSDDFTARSPDELSLSKGDRVELIERDDDFGDGWYLGKHLTHGGTGLFPEGESFISKLTA
jgi:hypothetical protein